ncbi:DinB family protein [Chryseobacterium lathyri]|uniref:Damage-inducible protein DinB n=1 Tax=Chryseobacterium lathyri TaxID=395933 RepID=A0ABT9SIV8_9FLAO|nr:DinB family protein [Chryseobacterium lathyri]MDP9959218.1 putative damage-inducible protein DinB [Chryseobacterium lathyri]MDQ0065228.1 putative damage-inducible protein DinB [Chryseobacterium lathyri]
MTHNELIINYLNETRRRSVFLWKGLPEDLYGWKPDSEAMTAIQMIRHVLQADYGWNMIINKEDMSNYQTPWEDRSYSNVEDEIEFAEPYRQNFLQSVRKFSEKELSNTIIIHPGNGAEKLLGNYLLRIAYHESVHAGQFLSYLRTMGVERPFIWD